MILAPTTLGAVLLASAPANLTVDASAIARAERASTTAGHFTAVELDRAQAGFALELPSSLERVGMDVRLEAIRSATPDSIQGIANDSLITRLAVTQVVIRGDLGPVRLGARAGLVEDAHRRRIADAWDLRLANAPLAERAGFGDTADLGGVFELEAFDRRLVVELGATNGEGVAEVEQDEDKNVSATLAFTSDDIASHHLVVSLQGVHGTRGAGATRADSLSCLAAVVGPAVGAGAEYTRAAGLFDRGDREGDALGVWLRGNLWGPWVGAWARFDRLDTDYAAPGSVAKRFGGGVFSTPVEAGEAGRLRVALGLQREVAATGAVPRPLPDAARLWLGVEFAARTAP